MARVRFLQAVGGVDYSYTPGEEVDLPGDQAEAWADGVRAELVRGDAPETPEATTARHAPRMETTVATPPETVTSKSVDSPAAGKKTVRRTGQ